MIDFKVLVKVNPEDSRAAIKVLGEKVLNDETAFMSVDPVWVRKQDYITVLPVQVALTVEMRAVVQANSPDTKFIVTGVTSENVDSLINEFGYKVYPTYTVKDVAKQYRGMDTCPEDEDPENNKLQSAGQAISPTTHQVKYWINGEEVPQEKWEEKKKDFTKAWNEVWGDFGKKMMEFLDR